MTLTSALAVPRFRILFLIHQKVNISTIPSLWNWFPTAKQLWNLTSKAKQLWNQFRRNSPLDHHRRATFITSPSLLPRLPELPLPPWLAFLELLAPVMFLIMGTPWRNKPLRLLAVICSPGGTGRRGDEKRESGLFDRGEVWVYPSPHSPVSTGIMMRIGLVFWLIGAVWWRGPRVGKDRKFHCRFVLPFFFFLPLFYPFLLLHKYLPVFFTRSNVWVLSLDLLYKPRLLTTYILCIELFVSWCISNIYSLISSYPTPILTNHNLT